MADLTEGEVLLDWERDLLAAARAEIRQALAADVPNEHSDLL